MDFSYLRKYSVGKKTVSITLFTYLRKYSRKYLRFSCLRKYSVRKKTVSILFTGYFLRRCPSTWSFLYTESTRGVFISHLKSSHIFIYRFLTEKLISVNGKINSFLLYVSIKSLTVTRCMIPLCLLTLLLVHDSSSLILIEYWRIW